MGQHTRILAQIAGFGGWKVAGMRWESASGQHFVPIAGYDVPSDAIHIPLCGIFRGPECASSCPLLPISGIQHEMILSKLFERFVAKTPVSVTARAAMEYAMAPEALDTLFGKHAESQYTRELLFSSVVDLMGVVVAKVEPSVHAAYQEVADSLPVSITSVYNKLNGLEPSVTSALVRHTGERLAPVVDQMGGRVPELLPGYQVRIIDGNHLAATERRLKVLRRSKAGPLPGHALVILDPSLMLVTDMIRCEDGHAQERSLPPEILALVAPKDVWVADRNFCTCRLLQGITDRGAFYVIRQHASLPVLSAGASRKRGSTETGEVFEESVTIDVGDGRLMKGRRYVPCRPTSTSHHVASKQRQPTSLQFSDGADYCENRVWREHG